MPEISFRLRSATVPAGQSCLTNLQGVLDAVQQFVTVQVPEGYTLSLVSALTPTTEQQSAIWIKLNGNDTPEGIYIYATGEWMRVPGVSVGHIQFWNGNLSEIPDGWHICDGNGGAPDLTATDHFWQGGDGGASGHYSVTATSYTICPIIFQGLGA